MSRHFHIRSHSPRSLTLNNVTCRRPLFGPRLLKFLLCHRFVILLRLDALETFSGEVIFQMAEFRQAHGRPASLRRIRDILSRSLSQRPLNATDRFSCTLKLRTFVSSWPLTWLFRPVIFGQSLSFVPGIQLVWFKTKQLPDCACLFAYLNTSVSHVFDCLAASIFPYRTVVV